MEEVQKLRDEIKELEEKLMAKRQMLALLENDFKKVEIKKREKNRYAGRLSADEVTRYSRQMLVPSIGTKGQEKLRKAKVLIVGAGGLGCPVSLYLAAAGIGHITIVDSDEVELSNLHRQILHTTLDLEKPKVLSVADKLYKLNNQVTVWPKLMHLNVNAIVEILSEMKYTLVIDATDNAPTRYLLNDACVLHKIPLVSGSALQLEGQITVYNYNDGPCYRCINPTPPPPEAVTSCGDGGVFGPVCGIIGILQALESMKVIMGETKKTLAGRYLTFDGSDCTFKSVRMTRRRANCEVCGEKPAIDCLVDYESFCRAQAHDKVTNINILKSFEVIEPKDLFIIKDEVDGALIDVRPKIEFDMCRLPGSINWPYSEISIRSEGGLKAFIKDNRVDKWDKIYMVCRRGNDSQRAIKRLKEFFDNFKFVNVKGGLHAYSAQVDSTFPVY